MGERVFGNRGRSLWLLAACLAWMFSQPASLQAKCKMGTALTPGDHSFTLEHDGVTHMVTLHVPPKYDGKTAVPLVFDLHGFSSNGPQQLGISGFPQVADMNNFLVVAPTGYMNSWNGDIAFGTAYEMMLDDVGFMKALLAKVSEMANVNRGKVYSTGLSNGAAMSNALGCKAADTFAGVAPVADPLDITAPTCMPANPISVIGFHGYTDEYVPYEGGPGGGPRLPSPFPSIPDTLKSWAKIMQCTGEPEVEMISGRNKCEIYRTCGGKAQVGYCSIEGGHVLYQQSVLDIAEYAWKFFEGFSLPLPDADADGMNDEDDNCASIANPDQLDANNNCVGDACECATPADCDDGKYCNGTETCTSGACVAGTPACAAPQSCDEATRQCGAAGAMPAAGAAAGTAGASAAQGGGPAPATAGSRATLPAAGGIASDPTVPGAAGRTGTVTAAQSGGAAGAGTAMPATPAANSDGGCRTAGGAGDPLAAMLSMLGVGLYLASRSRRRS
jgi:polyhydroxybutyrate depolymerase